MTLPKPHGFRAKKGRKTKRERARLDKMLKRLAKSDDLTAWQASLYARCGYDYALRNFRDGRYFKRMASTRIEPLHVSYEYPLDKRGKKLVLKIMKKHGIL